MTTPKVCAADGCDRRAWSKGYCHAHYELWTRSQPSGQRVEDQVEWAEQILRQYAPERLAPPVLRVVSRLEVELAGAIHRRSG